MNKLLSVLLLIVIIASCNNSSEKKDKKNNDSEDAISSNIKLLSSPADSVSAEPYLFTDKNGVVYLSWIEKDKEKSLLKFSRLDNGQWLVPAVIASGANWFVNWADYPMLVSDGGDSMIAHILEKSKNSTYAYDIKLITSFNKGSSWNTEKIRNCIMSIVT